MKVLIACECSGVVREAFAELGHDAWSCDIIPSDQPGQHLQCDVLTVLDQEWDLMIAHPPCTYLTTSAEWAYKESQTKRMKPTTLIGVERREAREQAVEFVLRLADAPIPLIAIENPVGVLSTRWRRPDQVIQPYQFGDDASKRTCLWLKELPPLIPTELIDPRMVCCGQTLSTGAGRYGCPNCCGDNTPVPRWANQTNGGQNKLPPSPDRGKLRSVTYSGIANAMASQWGRR